MVLRNSHSAKRIHQPFAVAAALAAGLFCPTDLLAQPQDPTTQDPASLERLLTAEESQFTPATGPAAPYQQLRPLSVAVPTSALPAKPAPSSPSAAEVMLQQIQSAQDPQFNRARVVLAQESAAKSTTWQAPVTAARPTVRQVGHQEALALNSPQSTEPVAHTARALPAAHAGLHQLRHVSMDQFERAVIEIWGNRIQTSASPDGRFVRVQMPNKVNRPLVMLIDRQTGQLHFEGDPSLADNWKQLMETIDRRAGAGDDQLGTSLLDRHHASMETIRQVVFLMGYGGQDQEGEAQLPPGTQLPGNQDDVVQGIQGLKKPVRIVEDAETGVITLIGDPEDVAIVRRELLRLSQAAQSKQPVVERIPLVNVPASSIEERAQEIYDGSYAALNGPAQITAIESPNMLVVVGQPKALEAIRKLVAEMDVESTDMVRPDFRAFQLKHLSAADAKRRLDNYFLQSGVGQGENALPSASVSVIADFRSNQVLVKGAQQYILQAETFLKAIDVDRGEAVNEVKIIPLKNALAEEIALVIQDAVSGQQPNANQAFVPAGGQNTGQNLNNNQGINAADNQSQLRSAMLSLRTRGSDGQLIEGGIMFDVRVTADRNSNSLVITGPAAAMPLVEELVRQLDKIPDAETQIKVFELVYADAETMLSMLQTLFGSTTQQGGQAGQGTNNLSQLPLQAASQSDGATLVNIRFSLEPRSNSIIASGPAGDLQVVEALLNRLDARAINSTKPRVYRLSNAPAQDVADAINNYLSARNDIIDTDPRTNTAVPAVDRAVIVTPEVVSNSLIVEALPEYRQEIEDIIKALDRRPPMVKVKILIAEVNLNSLEEFGVQVGVQDSLLFDRGTIIDAAGQIADGIGFPFNASPLPVANARAYAREQLAGQAVSNLGIGTVNTGLGYGGLVLSAGNESVSLLMRALKDRQAVRVLSKPHIMTVENLQGRVAIGASVSRIAGTTLGANGLSQQNIEFQDVGVILEVTPRVSPDGMIILSVNAEKSSVDPSGTGTVVGFGGADGDQPILAPDIKKTEATTTLMARSGQTMVFSGLIEESKTHIERGAPILSDLPVIGPLFKFESDEAARTELMIIMTPYLVTDDQDLMAHNQDEMERMHWCLCDVAEVYGNTDFNSVDSIQAPIETVYPDADPAGRKATIQQREQAPVANTAEQTAPAPAPATDTRTGKKPNGLLERWRR